MTTVTHCLECGAELNATEASGLCPKCMLKLGLASQLASGTLPATARGLTRDGVIVEPFDFGRYKVLRLLGRGGMGAVYEAEDQETQRRVALKVLGHSLDTAEMRSRFLREGQIAASVSHPNVVGIFHAHEIEKTPVIAMELVHDGTLKDRVQRRGWLFPEEAVDLTLQMIDGLEAAHAAGVLHRDVKPANCFITPEGTVKVGDFGLSISTLIRAEADLTATGAVLGTPAFAAPEQLRGREVDVRADIYAVGATLYYLITGKQTHEADTLVSLIAAVLERAPREPRVIRPELPQGLSKLVMRCLEKDPAHRPQTYEQLRSALLPFSSTAPTPATVGLRLLAGVVEAAILAAPMLILKPFDSALIERTPEAFLLLAGWALFFWAYYAVSEGIWGASIGKAICGLRVVSADRKSSLGIGRCFARAVIFSFPEYAGAAVAAAAFSAREYQYTIAASEFTRADAVMLLLMLSLFVTMRRRNGFAAIQDLLTGTRVVTRPAAQVRPSYLSGEKAAPRVGDDYNGPYAVIRCAAGFIDAWDPVLRRAVWIRLCDPGAAPLSATRRDLSRVGRLRWLTGERTEEGGWDAFEAPEGQPLTAFLDGAQPWARVRFWLLDLAEELHLVLAEGALTEKVGPQHLWVTNSGRAILLDFPAPGAPPAHAAPVQASADAIAFVTAVADAACAPRMPLHAHEFLSNLRAGRFDEIAVVAANLRSLVTRPAAFTQRRRLFTIALPALLALGIGLFLAFELNAERREFDQLWEREFPGRPSLRKVLDIPSWNGDRTWERRHRISGYVAAHYLDVISDPTFWKRPQTIAAVDDTMASFAFDAVAENTVLTPAEVARNDALVAAELREHAEFERGLLWRTTSAATLLALSFMLTVGALWTLIGCAPLGMYLAGAALVRADGVPVSRGRAFLRSVPVLISAGLALQAFFAFFLEVSATAFVALISVNLVLLLVGAIWAVRRPERGLPDLLARTYVVPR